MKTFERHKQPALPKIKVSGGPHAKNVEIAINDEPMSGITRAELVFDVTDAVRATFFRVAEAYVDVEGVVENRHRVKVYRTETKFVPEQGLEMFRELVVSGDGDTIADALRAAAVAAELAETPA